MHRVEDILVQSGRFCLPSKRSLQQPGFEHKVLVGDVTEVEVERPQKNKNTTESGKHKCHTLKGQVLTDYETGMILCTACAKGRMHE